MINERQQELLNELEENFKKINSNGGDGKKFNIIDLSAHRQGAEEFSRIKKEILTFNKKLRLGFEDAIESQIKLINQDLVGTGITLEPHRNSYDNINKLASVNIVVNGEKKICLVVATKHKWKGDVYDQYKGLPQKRERIYLHPSGNHCEKLSYNDLVEYFSRNERVKNLIQKTLVEQL
jgi:hypothetical protein